MHARTHGHGAEEVHGTAKQVGTGEGKDWTTALVLSILLGPLGIDRYYLGRTLGGILKGLLGVGVAAWWLYDLIAIAQNRLPDAQGRPLVRG